MIDEIYSDDLSYHSISEIPEKSGMLTRLHAEEKLVEVKQDTKIEKSLDEKSERFLSEVAEREMTSITGFHFRIKSKPMGHKVEDPVSNTNKSAKKTVVNGKKVLFYIRKS